MNSMLPIFAEDLKLNRMSYNFGRFVFFYPGDSLGNPLPDAPDFSKEMKLGLDTAFTVFLPPADFDSLHDKEFFLPDPDSKVKPWNAWCYATLIDHQGRIRGYYDIRYAAELKRMKEDIRFIKFRDEAAETLEESKVEQKKK
jgi:hypothetical protein